MIWQILLRYKFVLRWILFLGVFIFVLYFLHLKDEVQRLKTELALTNEKFISCYQTNQELTKELKLQHKKYQAKINKLLKLANKPPKIIKIPKVITKKVYITPKQCQQMAIMIDEFVKAQEKKQCEK